MNSTIEILEARIAPATFLVSSVELKVTNTANPAEVPDAREIFAAATTGASRAVFLAAGDKLVFDANANGLADAGESLLAKVAGGGALAFLFDADGNNAFSRAEFTGLAVSDLFTGKIGGDIGHGTGGIVTALDALGNLTAAGVTLTLQRASISTLNVIGAVDGHILAGDDIANVTIGTPQLSGGSKSVGTIASGLAASGRAISFGTVALTTAFTIGAGLAGGDISEITLALGAQEIAAGTGGDNAPGGVVKNIVMQKAAGSVSIVGGTGGAGNGATAGAGGGVDGITIATPFLASLSIAGGAGGAGSAATSGGAGGALLHVNADITSASGVISMNGGAGGAAGALGGAGGIGGALRAVSLTSGDGQLGGISLGSGVGGAASVGAGGSVNEIGRASCRERV